MREHRFAPSRAQHVGVVDVGATGHDGVDQRQDLAPREGAADTSSETDSAVHQLLQAQAEDQGADKDQPGIGHQVGIVEAHPQTVDTVRYSTH